jgi:anti-sigma factor RsiW
LRTPPRFEAIRATAMHHRTSSPWPPKSPIVETVAHLSIVMMGSYALKELSEAEMLRVEKHVARCPKCRDHLEGDLAWAAAMRSPFRRYVEKLIEAERKKAAKR